MLSVVKRYRKRLALSLSACFPRTTAYLREQGGAPLSHGRPEVAVVADESKAKAHRPARKPRTDRTTAGPAQSEPAKREGLYGPERLKVSERQIQAMRERVEKAVRDGILSAPSDEQWAMITCRHPVARVFAGAGSGKSTTLLLRVVFMLCHLQIPLHRLTVISFTNASCAELRERLVEILRYWNYPFGETQARQCIRTFHSAMSALAQEALDRPAWFEQLGQAREAEPEQSASDGSAQRRLLQQAYEQCYEQSPAFRERVDRLLGLPAAADNAKAPDNRYRLAGEYRAVPLYEAFNAQAGFIESIGMRIDQLPTFGCSAAERDFVEALQLFWAAFGALLQQQNLMTFNGGFQRLSDRLDADGSSMPSETLESLSHLLIDEFQDISPQIVQWLQAVHRELARREATISLMAIGDDWQSIYGWRGSSPELFMDFDRYFPFKGRPGKSLVLRLETNYRSVEPIISDAEAVLAGVAYKQDKACKASKTTAAADHGVKVVSGFDIRSGLPDLIRDIHAQCATRSTGEKTAVLLLSRRNDTLKRIQAQLDRTLPVQALTIHRAKGLQAEVAIIVDDGDSPQSHPLRNALYASSGFFRNSYDQAMADENLRLAYVAITRGVSRVIWYTRKPQGATALLARPRSE